ncbi:MAG: nucleotide-binding universal stress UspA family protein [Natronomonas sp.]
MYQTIVCPTDGSFCATRGLDHAIELAKRYDAELHVLYVVQDTAIPPTVEQPSVVDGLTSAGETILDRAAERARNADFYQLSTHLRRGVIHQRIIELADGQDADLVVMGAHARSGSEQIPLGSTTERVLRRRSVPVLAFDSSQHSV